MRWRLVCHRQRLVSHLARIAILLACIPVHGVKMGCNINGPGYGNQKEKIVTLRLQVNEKFMGISAGQLTAIIF